MADPDTSLHFLGLKLYHMQQNAYHSAAHCQATIHLSRNKKREIKVVVSALFDTGAISANYISMKIFEKIRCNIGSSNIIKKRMRVGLADDHTVIETEEVVKLHITFKTNEGRTQRYKGDFVVLPMGSNDLIIGLPAICSDLHRHLGHMIKTGAPKTTEEEENIYNHTCNMIGELLTPWKNKEDTEAPEEQEVMLPAQFENVTSFLGKTRAEAIAEFKDMFTEHVSEEFRKETKVLNLLMSKGLKVFVPEEWTGIKGVVPLDLKTRDTLPHRMKPRARPINPRLWEAAEKEFFRLRGYMYSESRSPWASCLVVAPKATKPFIRFCGDYVEINKHIEISHFTIPTVKHEIEKVAKFKIYLDIDMTNAFHQLPITQRTKDLLSIQTPWGQYAPNFLPEGVAPATSLLQETVKNIFGDFAEWCIAIFDNMLILANDYQDAYNKLDMFLDRCIEKNVILKFAKSWLGFRKVKKFFGYDISQNSYELSEDRKKAILEIPFPESGNKTKKVRSLLGSGVFFVPFLKNYASMVKNLTDLTKKSFNWDESTWKHDYRKQFEDYKLALQTAAAIHYPDYNLPWVIRTDASDYGVGGALIQIRESNCNTNEEIAKGAKPQEEIIALVSKKFSEQAARWATIEKEGYGIFYTIQKLAYYLRGKEFIVETDHNNLVWMEASTVPKIVRWRIFLQSFNFKLKHIKGKDNVLADTLSRVLCMDNKADHEAQQLRDTPERLLVIKPTDQYIYCSECEIYYLNNLFGRDESEQEDKDEPEIELPKHGEITTQEALRKVHNGRVGHGGASTTWKRMNKNFPGHLLPYKSVAEFVHTCPTCQKTRRENQEKLIPWVRHLKPPHQRSAIGIDAVAITPNGQNGETHIEVIVNLFTKLVHLTPVKGCTAHNLALAVWNYWCTYGFTDMIISDLGPDLKSKMFQELTELVGVRHAFCIANRHANGCERVIKEVNRHLRAIVYDEKLRNRDVFSDTTLIPTIQSIMNTSSSSETAFTPFELTFGSADKIYGEINTKDIPTSHALLDKLNENLITVRKISKDYQQSLNDKRTTNSEEKMNQYQKGDFVLFDAGSKPHPKMACRHKGPYEVIRTLKNDIECRNIITGAIQTFSTHRLSLFFGNKEEAMKAATRDDEQFTVTRILSYRGDSNRRTEMMFTVEYADGDILEVPWTYDLFQCVAYETFCKSKPHLFHLTMDTGMADKFRNDFRKKDITTVKPGDTVFIDLRFFTDAWFEELNLPDSDLYAYVMEFKYTHWYHKKSKRKISGIFTLNKKSYALDGYLTYAWGEQKHFDETNMILVTKDIADKFPSIWD